jgi:hypothetical protein
MAGDVCALSIRRLLGYQAPMMQCEFPCALRITGPADRRA